MLALCLTVRLWRRQRWHNIDSPPPWPFSSLLHLSRPTLKKRAILVEWSNDTAPISKQRNSANSRQSVVLPWYACNNPRQQTTGPIFNWPSRKTFMKTFHSCNYLIFSQLCQMTRVHDWCGGGVTERAPKVQLDPADSHKTAKLRPRQRPVDTHSGQEKVSHILRFGALNLSPFVDSTTWLQRINSQSFFAPILPTLVSWNVKLNGSHVENKEGIHGRNKVLPSWSPYHVALNLNEMPARQAWDAGRWSVDAFLFWFQIADTLPRGHLSRFQTSNVILKFWDNEPEVRIKKETESSPEIIWLYLRFITILTTNAYRWISKLFPPDPFVLK